VHTTRRLWRIGLAVVFPALALAVAFPVLHAVMTVYNEPDDPFAAFVFGLVLALVPGVALALVVRNKWLFAAGVVLSGAAAVVVAVQIAGTDDAQAGLAALALPVYMGMAFLIVAAIRRCATRTGEARAITAAMRSPVVAMIGQCAGMAERMLTEREAFRAARYFLEQWNEREQSTGVMLLISDMAEGTWEKDPLMTSDPAQWHDWVASVNRVVADRAP
jgi:hypothetical protein